MYGADCIQVRVSANFSVPRCRRPMCGSARSTTLAVEFEHEAQHAVRRGVLRTEVDRVVADFSHGRRSP